MNANRRDFLKTSLASAGVVAWGMSVPRFLSRTAAAAPAAGRPGARDTILVVVQLTGGNDGLNTVIPYADDLYHKARPTLRHTKERVLRVDDHIGRSADSAGCSPTWSSRRMTASRVWRSVGRALW